MSIKPSALMLGLCATLLLLPGLAAARAPAAPPRPIEPLTIYVRTVWPPDVSTVGDAVDYVLAATGYRLTLGVSEKSLASDIVHQPLPPIAKINRTMAVIDVLQLLAGPDGVVVVDPAHMLVSFTRKERTP